MNYSKESLDVTCTGTDFLDFSELERFQGFLKIRNDNDINKIAKSFEKHGFATPFFVWKDGDRNRVLDGHGRFETISLMAKQGVKIPKLPVIFVDCKTEKEAKELLLKMNSSYGRMTRDSVMKFIDGDIKLDLNSYKLPEDTLVFSKLDVEAFSIPSNPSFKGSTNPMFKPIFENGNKEPAEAKINNKDIPNATVGRYCISFGKVSFLISENEYNLFKQFYDKYKAETGSDEGVIYEIFNRFN